MVSPKSRTAGAPFADARTRNGGSPGDPTGETADRPALGRSPDSAAPRLSLSRASYSSLAVANFSKP